MIPRICPAHGGGCPARRGWWGVLFFVLLPAGFAGDSPGPGGGYESLYVAAAKSFSDNQLEEALRQLDLAEQAKPDQVNTANLRGAIYTRKRDWPQAIASFQRAAQLQPDLPMVQFNLGEVFFLSRNYPEAEKKFRASLSYQPENELGYYKIFLCALFQGKKDEAESVAARLISNQGSPAGLYAQAARAFASGKKSEGMELVAQAFREFPPEKNAVFADSLVELGFLQGEVVPPAP